MTEVICTIITAISLIVVAMIGENVKKANDKADHRGELRREESLLSLRMMDATLQLSVVSANALTNGHNNGNVETSRKAAEQVSRDYADFMRRTTAYEVGE